MICKYFLPVHKLSFCFIYGFLCWQKHVSLIVSLFYYFFFFNLEGRLCSAVCRILVPLPGISCPLLWKFGVLSIRPPWNSLICLFLLLFLLLWESSLRKYCYDSSRAFMVSLLIFKSANHLVYGVEEFSTFTDLHAAVQCSQSHLPKKLSFLLPPLSKINWH